MKLILSICLVVLGTSVSFGQDAKSQGILDKLSTKMKGLKSFYIEFSANIKNADSGQNENEIERYLLCALIESDIVMLNKH